MSCINYTVIVNSNSLKKNNKALLSKAESSL